MSNRLSFSQISKWEFCNVAWKFHYVDRIRPTSIPSPLIYGSAIGKTFEYILKGGYEANKFFDEHWLAQEINGTHTILKDNPNIVYLKSDFDEELGSNAYESLRSKAHLMIQAFIDKFLPLVTKLYSTEEMIELFSGEDSNIGYCDAVVDMVGYDTPLVIDFKTTGRKYEENSVRESVQLGQYLYTLGDKYNTKLAGYVVFLKQIRKNRQKICSICGHNGSGARFKTCNKELIDQDDLLQRCNGAWIETIHPECDVQIIIDEIPLEFQEQVIDNIGIVNDKINTGEIVPNYKGCDDNGWGRPCEYRELCHNNSLKGLVQLDAK